MKFCSVNFHALDIERLPDDYYAARGRDREGIPLTETLVRLGVSESSQCEGLFWI